MSFNTWGAFNVWSGGVGLQPPDVILSGGDLIVVNGDTYTPPNVQVISYDGSTLAATPDIAPDVNTNGTYVITYTSEPDMQGQTGTAQWVVQVVESIASTASGTRPIRPKYLSATYL